MRVPLNMSRYFRTPRYQSMQIFHAHLTNAPRYMLLHHGTHTSRHTHTPCEFFLIAISSEKPLFFHTARSATPPIPRPSPPPLLQAHRPTIKRLLPQLDIDLIMRLTHPTHQPPPPRQPLSLKRILPPPHPRLEILRAVPARVEPAEQGQELFHL